MVRILRDILLREELKKTYGKPLKERIKYFWNMGWNNMPEVMVTAPVGIIPLILCFIYLPYSAQQYDRLPKYFNEVTVLRPDDPRVPLLRKDDKWVLEMPTGSLKI